MGIESDGEEFVDADRGTDGDRAAFAAELGTEDVAFVDGLNGEIATLVEDDPALDYEYVLGDVSDFGVSSNGHGHFDLVHDGSTLHCVVFASRLHPLEDAIEDGTLVAVNGDVSYYEREGSVSLVVRQVVEIGEGSYRQVYRENRETLAEDGCLDDAAKQDLPAFPTTVGIVTSAESDAREDAVTSIHDRHPDVDVVVQDATVQGDRAMLSMMDAVSALDDDARVDVIVLTRGGGADRHLRVFNETPLCRVVHETSTPVVAAIGHENDRALADDVADRRVMTPTEVGEIVPRKDRLAEDVEELSRDLDRAYARTARAKLDSLRDRLDAAYGRTVADELDSLGTRLDHAYDTLEREKAHEAEKAEAVESYRHTTRRQRVLIAALVVLLLITLGLLLVNL